VDELGVEVVEWYNLLGWEGEPGLEELLKKDVVCVNGVHLTNIANSFAAVSLCCRIAEVHHLLRVRKYEETKAGLNVRIGKARGKTEKEFNY
jgi:hypothetical protein